MKVETETAADAALQEAREHAESCARCYRPIVDDEGNPGLFGEACRPGLVLLVRYCKTVEEFVPYWVEKLLGEDK